MKWFLGGAILVVLIVAALVAVDLTRTSPAVPSGRCLFVDNLILPDRCLSNCSSGADCPTGRTKPYFLFWTEPTACPDAVICAAVLSTSIVDDRAVAAVAASRERQTE